MPIYEYTCKDCGASCEKLLHVCSQEELKFICPECGSDHLEKAISLFNAPINTIPSSCQGCINSENSGHRCPFNGNCS